MKNLEVIICVQKRLLNNIIFKKEKCSFCDGKNLKCGHHKQDTALYYQQRTSIRGNNYEAFHNRTQKYR